MSAPQIAILATGLVTSVGLGAPATCAAMRAKLTNPSATRFIDSNGEPIMAHQVALQAPWRGIAKLARMAAMAIEECLVDVPKRRWRDIPLLLCVAETDRPGRPEGLDDLLFAEIESTLGARFSAASVVVPHGRVAVAVALAQARAMIHERQAAQAVVAAVDSLVRWPTLIRYQQQDRLLMTGNSNGFMPGEGAGALRVGKPTGDALLACTGFGFAMEQAHIESEQPLRAEGLSQAIRAALAEAGCRMHDMDLRIADLSGEQYYFKEAALAVSRTLRQRKAEFDIWHPSECTGEAGAVAGAAMIALADAACRKGFSAGPRTLAHMANDDGRRAAVTLHYRAAA